MRDNPRLGFERLPSYARLNPIERSRKKPRRREAHNRPLDTPAGSKTSLRARVRQFQTVRHKVESTIEGRPKPKTNK